MPLMDEQNTLQMEWCLDCHRNPAKNLRPTSQIYNMAWEKPAADRPVWCAVGDEKSGVPTAQSVNCVVADVAGATLPAAMHFEKFTDQDRLGHFLLQHYKIRTPKDLTSC